MSVIIIHDVTDPKDQERWFMLPLDQYPYKREPALGDVLPLKLIETVARDEHTHEYTAHIDGIYAVVIIAPGEAKTLYPVSRICGMHPEINPDAQAFRLCVFKEAELILEVEPIVPERI